MLKSQRHEQLMDLCSQRGMISVRQAAKIFGISEMTVRRDFDELASTGAVVREHGGIRLPEVAQSVPSEIPYFDKLAVRQSEKQRIAQAACALIEPDDTVFLGPGSTCAAIARALPPVRLRIVTNSIIALNMLQTHPGLEVCCLGGQYRRRSGSFIGPVAEDSLAPLGIDKCFIGTNGVMSGVISCSNLEEGRLQALACDRAASRFLVCDSSKLDQLDFYNFYNLDRIDAVITDAGASDEQRFAIESATSLIVAD